MTKSSISQLVVSGLCAFVGGFVALKTTTPAQAQQNNRTIGSEVHFIEDPIDRVVVGRNGIHFVSMNQKPIALLGAEGMGATLLLFDASGKPSIRLSAGPDGTYDVDLSGSASVTLANRTGAGAAISAKDSGATLLMGPKTPTFSLTTDSVRTHMELGGTNQSKVVAHSEAKEGRVSVTNTNGQRLAEILAQQAGAVIVKNRDATIESRINAGQYTVQEKGNLVFAAPEKKSAANGSDGG